MTDYGDAVVDVRLDTSQAERQLSDLVSDITSAARAVEGRNFNVEINTSKAAAKVRGLSDEIRKAVRGGEANEIDIAVNTSKAEARVRELQATIRKAVAGGDRNNFDLSVSTTKAQAEVAELQRSINTATNRSLDPIDILVDSSKARVEIAELQEVIRTARRVTEATGIDVTLTTGPAQARINELVDAVRRAERQIENNEIDIKVDTSAAEARVRGLDRTVRRLVGVFAGAQLAQGFTRLTGGIAGFATEAVGQIQTLQAGLTGLFGELDGNGIPQTERFIGQLKEIATTSTIAFDTLASSAQKFQATFKDGDFSTALVQTLGDVNAVLGGSTATFDRAALALTQISAKGVQLEEINQLREALPGFDALGAIAEARGISVAETFKLIENRGLTGGEGIDILVKAMETFPGAAGAMERQSKTLTGSIENLRTVVSLAASTAFGPFGAAVSAAVGILRGATVEGGEVADIFGNVNDAFTDVVDGSLDNLIPAVVSLGESFVILVEGVEPVINKLLPEMADLAPEAAEGVAALIGVVVELSLAALPLAEVLLPLLTTGLELLTDGAEALGPALTPVVAGLIAVKAAAVLTDSSFIGVGRAVSSLVSSMATSGAPLTALRVGILDMSDKAKAATVGLASVAAGVGAFAFATEDGTKKIVGLASAVGGIATGFAVGGPVGGAVASLSVGVGLIAGEFKNAKERAAEFTAEVEGLAEALSVELDLGVFALKPGADLGLTDTIRGEILDALDSDDLAALVAAGLSIDDIITVEFDNLQLEDDLERGAARIASFRESAEDDTLGARRAALDLSPAADAAFEEAVQSRIDGINRLRAQGNITEADIQVREIVNYLSDIGQPADGQLLNDLLGVDTSTITSLQEAQVLLQTITGESGSTRVGAEISANVRQISEEFVQAQLEANALEAEMTPLRDAIALLGLDASGVEFTELDDETLDAVKASVEELQGLLGEFASGAATAILPGVAGTIDQVADQLATENEALRAEITANNDALTAEAQANNEEAEEAARDSFDERLKIAKDAYDDERSAAQGAYEDAQFAAKTAFDDIEEQAGRFKFPDFEFPDFEPPEFEFTAAELPDPGELPDIPPVTIRAVIDQFRVNQESSEGITAQFRDLAQGGFDNITFELGQLLTTDPEQVDLFLAELFPEGVLSRQVAGEFDRAIGANSAAQAQIVTEWTTIAETIAPILGQAIAAELAEVLGVEYTIDSKFAPPDDTPIMDVADRIRLIETVMQSDGTIAGAPTEIEVDVRFSAASLEGLAAVGIAAGIPLADGGVLDGRGVQTYASGGIAMLERYANSGSENHVAQISRAQSPFRVWAEPETGGEAYIPMGEHKRHRSEEILGIVADKFGKELSAKGTLAGLRDTPSVTVVQQAGPSSDNGAMLDRISQLLSEISAQKSQMAALAAAVAQMPPITVQAAGGDPENAASKIYWGHRKRLVGAGR